MHKYSTSVTEQGYIKVIKRGTALHYTIEMEKVTSEVEKKLI